MLRMRDIIFPDVQSMRASDKTTQKGLWIFPLFHMYSRHKGRSSGVRTLCLFVLQQACGVTSPNKESMKGVTQILQELVMFLHHV